MPQRQRAAEARRDMLSLTLWFSQWDHMKHKDSDARMDRGKEESTVQREQYILALYGNGVGLCNGLGPYEGRTGAWKMANQK